jgi:hypothetical protein
MWLNQSRSAWFYSKQVPHRLKINLNTERSLFKSTVVECSSNPIEISKELFHEDIQRRFGINILKKPLSLTNSENVYHFLKRWNNIDYFYRIITTDTQVERYKKNEEWFIPLGISFFIKDPSNGF